MLKAILFFGLTLITAISNAVNITFLKVPSTYILTDEANTRPLVLDCEFDVSPNETGQVLKWLLNGKQIYQWIPNRAPNSMGAMKKRIDTTFSLSPNSYDRYRALSIIKPEWNMTGTYTCSVQTFQSISQEQAELQIISPETGFNLEAAIDEEGDDLAVTCSVQDIYPAPHLAILIDSIQLGTELKAEKDKSGLFDVIATGKKPRSDISSPATITCVLTITGTEYEKTMDTIFYDEVEIFTDENVLDEEIPSAISRLEASTDTEESHGLRCHSWSLITVICICIAVSLS